MTSPSTSTDRKTAPRVENTEPSAPHPAPIEGREDIVWHDALNAPFQIFGLCDPYDRTLPFHRMKPDVAEGVNSSIAAQNYKIAGGRVRFSTDSPYIAIAVETPSPIYTMPHMPLSGSQGLDLYVETDDGTMQFVAAFFPQPSEIGGTFFQVARNLRGGELRHYTLNLPLYGGCKTLQIGLKDGSTLAAGTPYRNEKPVLFYGSSITQGACASRPGNCYQGHLSHHLNMHYRNFGFAGNAKGEPLMAQYLAEQPMAAFVCDYDHNAPTPQHLRETLTPFYRTIRDAQPTVPFVFVSSPGANHGDGYREMVLEAYRNAVEGGDENVYFVDGGAMLEGDCADTCTVDGCHPNDLGFYRMYQALYPVLKKILFSEQA